MKKIILGIITILTIFSCDVAQDKVVSDKVDVSFGVALPQSNSRNLSALTNPTVDFTIVEGTTVYMSAADIPLTNDNGVFKLNTTLRKGSSYTFTQFTVKDGSTTAYLLDETHTINTTGFTVDAAGVVTPNPAQVYLNNQLPDEYTDKTSQRSGLTLVEDFFTAENLTFKVQFPTTVSIAFQHAKPGYSNLFTSLSGTNSNIISYALTSGDIVDLDAREVVDNSLVPAYNSHDGENDDLATTYTYSGYNTGELDYFRFQITEGTQTYYIYFDSTTYNKKEVFFTTMGN